MSIPAAGWLAEVDNTLQLPDAAPLPEPFVGDYGDGTQGDFIPTSDDANWSYRLVTTGFVDIVLDSGVVGSSWGFLISLRMLDAYGVILLDMIDPPEVTSLVVDDTPNTPVDVSDDFPVFDAATIEACCSLFLAWLFDGTYTFNGLKKFGADI